MQDNNEHTTTKERNGSDSGHHGHDGTSRAQTNTKRFVFSTWRDGGDHELCTWAMVDPPQSAPYLRRTGVATAAWIVVAREGGRQLICNKLHDGPCEWPWDVPSQGEPVASGEQPETE